MIVSIIAAYAENDRAIGHQGRLPWRLAADLARFKALTMGHSLLMGRRTFESLEGRDLPGRRIVVLTRGQLELPGSDAISNSLSAGLTLAEREFGEDELFLAGGGRVYREALERGLVDRMYLTVVHAKVPADTFFPEFDEGAWREIARQEFPVDDRNQFPTTFRFLVRKPT